MRNKIPGHLSINDFTYELPEDRIAKYPVEPRDSSKLLVYKEEVINEDVYGRVASYIPEDSILVMNNTKVVEARILFTKSTGSTIEIFCL